MSSKKFTGHETVRKKMKPKVEQFFRDHGCELLDEYIRDTIKVNFLCKCGHIGYKSYDKFRYRPYCKTCGKNMVIGENHYYWNPDIDYKKRLRLISGKSLGKLRSFWLNITLKTTPESTKKIGYTPEQLQKHISSHPNYKEGWNFSFDHIFPISAFVSHGIEDLSIINHLTNIRPVDKKENMNKGSKYNKSEFYAWLDSIGYTNYEKQTEEN